MSWKANTGQKIERLYAWIATEAEGGEGVCAMSLGGMMMPLIGADSSLMKRSCKGRPRLENVGKTNEAKKPWLKLEMSRRTWYRRQAEKRKGRE